MGAGDEDEVADECGLGGRPVVIVGSGAVRMVETWQGLCRAVGL